MITQAGLNRSLVLAALWGRMMRKELEKDAECLAVAISKQTGVPLNECVTAVVDMADAAMTLTVVITMKKPELIK